MARGDFMRNYCTSTVNTLKLGNRYTVWTVVLYYIMAGHAIVVVKDITLLFYHGKAVILTLW